MPSEIFTVYWTDPTGNQHRDVQHVPLKEAAAAVERLCKGPAAQIGLTREVLMTDGLDLTCFKWVEGEVVFPEGGYDKPE